MHLHIARPVGCKIHKRPYYGDEHRQNCGGGAHRAGMHESGVGLYKKTAGISAKIPTFARLKISY